MVVRRPPLREASLLAMLVLGIAVGLLAQPAALPAARAEAAPAAPPPLAPAPEQAAAAPPEVHLAPAPPDAIVAFFSPNRENREERIIANAISSLIEGARSEVIVGMFQFTSTQLARRLAEARARGVAVLVLLDSDQARNAPYTQHEYLVQQGVSVRFVELPGDGPAAPKYHNKLCVVDREVVVTGSFNWTVAADEENYENVVILRSRELARRYREEFARVWEDEQLTRRAEAGGR